MRFGTRSSLFHVINVYRYRGRNINMKQLVESFYLKREENNLRVAFQFHKVFMTHLESRSLTQPFNSVKSFAPCHEFEFMKRELGWNESQKSSQYIMRSVKSVCAKLLMI